jgi:hypothetical protein
MNELTQEKKQAIWAAGCLARSGYTVEQPGQEWQISYRDAGYRTFTDAELIAYATEYGMELPPELVGPKAGGLER